MTTIEVMRKALEAIHASHDHDSSAYLLREEALTALRAQIEALEKVEPVAFAVRMFSPDVDDDMRRLVFADQMEAPPCADDAPLYTAPIAPSIPAPSDATVEQRARDALHALGSTRAQSLSAGDLLALVCDLDHKAMAIPALTLIEPPLRRDGLPHQSAEDTMDRTPRDWELPDWGNAGRVHEWKNHISEEVRALWQTFTAAQKQALARQAHDCAMAEDWV